MLLSKCDQLWAFGDRASKGMSMEIEKAKRKGQPIRWFDSNCKALGAVNRRTEQVAHTIGQDFRQIDRHLTAALGAAAEHILIVDFDIDFSGID